MTPLIDQIREQPKENREQETEELTDELGSLVRELKSGKYQYVTPETLNKAIRQNQMEDLQMESKRTLMSSWCSCLTRSTKKQSKKEKALLWKRPSQEKWRLN